MKFYMSQKEAIKNGFTHHGKMFGVPIWVTDNEAPSVATKFALFEIWLTVGTIFFQIANCMGLDVMFPIQIGSRILEK